MNLAGVNHWTTALPFADMVKSGKGCVVARRQQGTSGRSASVLGRTAIRPPCSRGSAAWSGPGRSPAGASRPASSAASIAARRCRSRESVIRPIVPPGSRRVTSGLPERSPLLRSHGSEGLAADGGVPLCCAPAWTLPCVRTSSTRTRSGTWPLRRPSGPGRSPTGWASPARRDCRRSSTPSGRSRSSRSSPTSTVPTAAGWCVSSPGRRCGPSSRKAPSPGETPPLMPTCSRSHPTSRPRRPATRRTSKRR